MNNKLLHLATIVLESILLLFGQFAFGQEKPKTEFDLELEVANRFIWRGRSYSFTPCLQPTLNLKRGNFSIGTWGSYTMGSEKYQESDINLSYSIKNFTFTLSDYFAPYDTAGAMNKYFNYDNKTTRHIYDAQLQYDFPANISLLLATMIYGEDKKHGTTDNRYSTYIELSYSSKIEEIDYKVFIGGTPNNEANFYGKTAGIVNMGVSAKRNLKITESYSVPVKISLIANPMDENIFVGLAIFIL